MSKQRRRNGIALVLGLVASGIGSNFAPLARARDASLVACSDWAEAIAIDGRGRALVAGTAADNRILAWEGGHAHYGDFALARLLPDGRADLEFGSNGSVIVDLGDFDSLGAVVPAIGGAVAAGTTSQRAGERSGPKDLVLLRVSDAGAHSTDFGEGGIARLNLGGSVSVASMDESFGEGGVVWLDFRQGAPVCGPRIAVNEVDGAKRPD